MWFKNNFAQNPISINFTRNFRNLMGWPCHIEF